MSKKTITSKLINVFNKQAYQFQKKVQTTVKNNLVRTPETDCYVSAVPLEHIKEVPDVYNQMDLKKYMMSKMKISNGSKYDINEANKIIQMGNTPQRAKLIHKIINLAEGQGKPKFKLVDIKYLLEDLSNKKTTNIKLDLFKNLIGLTDKNGTSILAAHDIRKITSSTQTQEQAQIKFDFAQKLAEQYDGNGEPRYLTHNIADLTTITNTNEQAKFGEELTIKKDECGNPQYNQKETEWLISTAKTPETIPLMKSLMGNYDFKNLKDMVSVANTPETAKFGLKFIGTTDENGENYFSSFDYHCIMPHIETPLQGELGIKLLDFKDKLGIPKLDVQEMTKIISKAKKPELAKIIIERTQDKEFLNKINSVDEDLGSNLYVASLLEEKPIDINRMSNLHKFLKENKANLQQFGEEKVTDDSITSLFDSSMIATTNLIDDGTIKYATKLKYKKFNDLIESTARFKTTTDQENCQKLKNNLAQLTTPEMKLDRLQTILELKSDNKQFISDSIDLIKPTHTTKDQINSAKEIFSSKKPYKEQINEFFGTFDVSENRKEKLEEFFKPKAKEEQLKVIDKQIETLNNSTDKTDQQKQAYLKDFEYRKIKINENPEETGKFIPTTSNLKILADKIESHINIPKSNLEFNNFINSQIYKKLNIKPTPALLENLNFDKQYMATISYGLKDKKFTTEFEKLITLVNENPTKPFSESREALKHNNQTRELFDAEKIDYEGWRKFNQNSFYPFEVETDVEEAARGAERNIVNEFHGDLFNSVDKTETNKIITSINNEGYSINEGNITKNDCKIDKKDLEKIVGIFKDTINKNPEFWDKPLEDKNAESLKLELMDHLLRGRKKEVADLSTMANVKMDLIVRLSNPDDIGRNLFFGNHVGCCTSIGGGNGFVAPQHLMNSFVRGMEIVDKKGNSYGNSMCYFAEVNGKPSFIVDSFEANGKLGRNPDVTDAIINYSKQVTKEMGKPDIPIYFGPNFNKIDTEKLNIVNNNKIRILGQADSETYIDAIGGHADVNSPHKGNLYKCPN